MTSLDRYFGANHWEMIKRDILFLILGLLILAITVKADNITGNTTLNFSVNTTNPIQSGTINIQLPAFITSNDALSSTLGSLWNEYIGWSIKSEQSSVQQLKANYNLSGIYDIPLLGTVFLGVWLFFSGHLGALLYMVQNAVLFTIIGWFVVKALLSGVLHKFIPIGIICDVIEGVIAALLAIGIASML